LIIYWFDVILDLL